MRTMPAGKRVKQVAKAKTGAMAKATQMAQRQSVALQSKASKKNKDFLQLRPSRDKLFATNPRCC